jgi:hypothetical protein
LSLACRPAVQNGLSYSFGKDGIKASASFTKPPQTLSEIRIMSQEPSKETVVAAQRGLAAADGSVRLEASGTVPAASTGLRILITCDASKNIQQDILINLSEPQLAGGSSVAGKLIPEQVCAK